MLFTFSFQELVSLALTVQPDFGPGWLCPCRLLPSSGLGRLPVRHSCRPSAVFRPKGGHWVEDEERKPGFFTLSRYNAPAGSSGADKDVLEVVLHEVDDVAFILAAWPLQESWNGEQALLDRLTSCLQYGPDGAKALFQHTLRGDLEAA